jgi:apolipoprotein N-acyltransferase
MLVLHETAPPYYFLDDVNMLKSKKFFDFVDTSRKYLVMGIPHRHYYKDSLEAPPDSRVTESRRHFDVFNSAILLEPGKNPKESTIHKKIKLVPFSERIPYQESLPFLKKWLTWGVGISGWQLGKERTIFDLNDGNVNTRFAVLICYESVFSQLVTEFTGSGAEFFIIVTNDGWWGDNAGPEQHNQYAVLRAIENRKWIARCAQTGVSCFIDPMGNIYNRIPYWNEGIINRNVISNTEKTFYVRNGDIIGVISFYAGLASFAACFVIYYVKKKKLKSIA